MNRILTSILGGLLVSLPLAGQITVGGISLIGFSTDDQEFAFVTLMEIPASASINFTDAGWDGNTSAFDTTYATSGTMTWTNDASPLAMGSVVHIGGGVISGAGSLSGLTEFTSGNKVNESLFAYTGSMGSPNLINGAIFGRDPVILTSGSISEAGETYVPASLTEGDTFQNLNSDDNGVYAGTTFFMDASVARLAFADINNWDTSNGVWPLNVNLQINFNIPEPSTYALMLGIGMLLFVVYRKRRSRLR